MTDEELIDVVKLCIQLKAPILKSDAEGLLNIIDRQRAELQALRNVAEVAEEYIREGVLPTRDGRLAESLSKWRVVGG